MRRERALLLLRLASGGVFVAFGAGKFINQASELASFRAYGLPAPEAFVIVIGAIELIGGALVITGLFTRWAALVLAGDMFGAIIVSGLGRGELVSLTLAPAQLLAMAALLRHGPGPYTVRRIFPADRCDGRNRGVAAVNTVPAPAPAAGSEPCLLPPHPVVPHFVAGVAE